MAIESDDFDVVVIGGGSAGTAAASTAQASGAQTAMINDGELGGLCILRGCMPTKSLLEAAHVLRVARNLAPFGIRSGGDPTPMFAEIMRRKSAHVARFKRAKIDGIETGGYTVIDGRAQFIDGQTVAVGDRRITARSVVIATGSQPSTIQIEGLDQVRVWTSDDVLDLTEQPSRVIVQGAGPIGLELAQFLARIGTEVLLVNRSAPLSKQDPDCGLELARALEAEPCLTLAAPGRIVRVRPTEQGMNAEIQRGDGTLFTWKADALLMATGRHADLEGLRLDQASIEVEHGRIRHDAAMRTSNPAVYVAGDATGNYQILHLANQEGAVAGFNASRAALAESAGAAVDPERTMDYRLKMSVVFTDPPFAEVGLSELEASVLELSVIVGKSLIPRTGRAITMETEFGAWKMIADPTTGEILGASILGPRADDLIHEISILMRFGGTVDDVLELPWYHPTLSEVILNVARDLKRQILRP